VGHNADIPGIFESFGHYLDIAFSRLVEAFVKT